jgi:exodeoxyribonuclease V alpha subunit
VTRVHESLASAVAAGLLRDLDRHFGRWLLALADRPSDALLLGAALASRQVGAGGVCLELAGCAGRAAFGEAVAGAVAPELGQWRAALLCSGVVGRPGERAPLILDGHDRLYLARYWRLESDLAARLQARAGRWAPGVERARLRRGLERFFGPAGAEPDPQRVAAAVAVLRPLAVVSGGPGTGKTHTVTSILALLADQARPARPRVALAAPTGKAAARLAEAVRLAGERLPLTAEESAAIPRQAMTLHRLLGTRPGRVGFRHDARNPLHLDALVVDEASMVDLALMSRLVAALPGDARLILLGDRDQLASVEAGAVLGEICGHGRAVAWSAEQTEAVAAVTGHALPPALDPAPAAIADSVVLLRRSYRFGPESGIGRLAACVNAGDVEGALAVLDSAGMPDVSLRPVREWGRGEALAERVLPALGEVAGAAGPGEALARLGRVRVLAALREGPWGVVEMNRLITRGLAGAGLEATAGHRYRGQPLLVTRNDYGLDLFNGDVGIVWPDPDAGGALRVWFERPGGGGLRRLPPARVPAPEPVYALTVHKSQGSEFDRVVLVLPERPTPVLSRELVYTAITRARTAVEIWGERDVLAAAIRTGVERSSGLRDALWG